MASVEPDNTEDKLITSKEWRGELSRFKIKYR